MLMQSVPQTIFAHPGQPQMFAKVILASRHPITGRAVHTLHLRYPRIIHAELMTHRVFCRNARSSRAVPVKTMLEEIRTTPFVPWHWTRNQGGMQGVGGWDAKVLLLGSAGQFVDASEPVDREAAWLHGRDMMCDLAESFSKAEFHKQVANRLVESFMWIDVLVTATDWANFLHLRDHPDAEPHIRDLAVLVGQALACAEVQTLAIGDWHLPYITWADWEEARGRFNVVADQLDFLKEISAARCARISYTPFDGDASYEREQDRYAMLVGNDAIHASPLEHQCTPDRIVTVETSYWDDEALIRDVSTVGPLHPELHGPLRGFIQFRKTVPNEAVFD
jgi:hypothetical protein